MDPKNPEKNSSRVTPLSIIALFVTLTEVTLGFAATQTTDNIQIALTSFAIIFPIIIAIAFFMILWSRPYMFYPPSEFGSDIDVATYVSALTAAPKNIVKETKDVSDTEGFQKYGNPDNFVLLFKARTNIWARSTKAMDVGNGCIVQVSTKYLSLSGAWEISEAVTYVPNVEIKNDPAGDGKHLCAKK